MICTIIRSFAALLLLLVTSEVSAGWAGCIRLLPNGSCVDYEIADLFSDIADANNNLKGLTNNTVMKDFRNQREFWLPSKQNTPLIADGVKDILGVLPDLRDDFITFIGGDLNSKCFYPSECYTFREDLKILFTELNGLKSKFPAFNKAGLVDANLASKAIGATPPFILFSMYRVMNRQPDWRNLPSDLSDIFDEMDDPEIFSLDLVDNDGAAVNAALFSSTSASSVPAVGNSTKTQRFCARRADKFDGVGRGINGNRDGWDQVRVNRIILVVTLLSDIWKFGLDLVPDDIDIGVSLLGEGGTLGIPSSFFTYYVKAVPLALESILKAIDVYHKNIGLCKDRFSEIESRLSSCGYYAEFALDQTAQGEYYQLVQRRFEMADEVSISHVQSDDLFAKSQVKLNKGLYAQAFTLLCDSYSSIGIAR